MISFARVPRLKIDERYGCGVAGTFLGKMNIWEVQGGIIHDREADGSGLPVDDMRE
jgi:hypothetical protein